MKFFKSIWRILSIHCEESSRLLSEGLDRDLRWDERWAIRLHALVCRSCKQANRQIRLLTATLRRRQRALDAQGLEGGGLKGVEMSPEARHRIASEIRRQITR